LTRHPRRPGSHGKGGRSDRVSPLSLGICRLHFPQEKSAPDRQSPRIIFQDHIGERSRSRRGIGEKALVEKEFSKRKALVLPVEKEFSKRKALVLPVEKEFSK
jgi:hypothetical protein